MEPLSVSFFSGRIKSMPIDIPIIKKYLEEEHPELLFRYFIGNEKRKNDMRGMGIRIAKDNFCRDAIHTLCVDTSLPEKWEIPSGAKILIALPFGARFLEATDPHSLNPALFEGFSHVLLPSPFMRDLFAQMHGKLKIQEQACAVSPFSWDICQEERRAQVREDLEYFYPGMIGKKICAIMTTGRLNEKEALSFSKFDLEGVLKNLGENWFLITNNRYILESAKKLRGHYLFSFGYLNNLRKKSTLLYIADMLITNDSRISGYYAARRKPLYILRYKNTYYERYIEKYFPCCFLKTPEEIAEKPLGQAEDADERRRMNEYLSFDVGMNPCQIINEWITEKERERSRKS